MTDREKVISIEELENTPSETYRETDDYENEISDLHNRLDIAEYDKERLREEVTNLEEKIKALEQEPILDKIRAEIKEESRFCPLTEGLERALEIIGKYTAEKE